MIDPINAELTLGSVYADYVLRAFGSDMLDSPDGLLDFMQALAWANDNIQPDPVDLTLTEKREAVVNYLSTVHGASLLDVEPDLGFTLDEAVNALCNGRPSIIRTFSELRWLEIESLLEEHPTVKTAAFAKLAGLSRKSADSILKYYGICCQKEVAA